MATREEVIEYLKGTDPMLTQAGNVRAFEKEWSEWLGVKHSVFVNSGSSANLITMAALRELRGGGQVIVEKYSVLPAVRRGAWRRWT